MAMPADTQILLITVEPILAAKLVAETKIDTRSTTVPTYDRIVYVLFWFVVVYEHRKP